MFVSQFGNFIFDRLQSQSSSAARVKRVQKPLRPSHQPLTPHHRRNSKPKSVWESVRESKKKDSPEGMKEQRLSLNKLCQAENGRSLTTKQPHSQISLSV